MISPYIVITPIIKNDWLNEYLECDVYFKCENLQKMGAFKTRGAFNALLRLTPEEQLRGVATHSSGNHAQALSLAANKLRIKATIVMPENSPSIKQKGVREQGAQIVFCKSTFEDRVSTLASIIEESGAIFIPPFDHLDVIHGQASCAYEILQELDSLDAIFAPVGGGGLVSGTCLAVQATKRNVKVFGGEPKNMDDAFRSFHSGNLEVNTPNATTVADGLRTNVGVLPLEIMQAYLSDIFLVEEEEILKAMELIWERLKIVVEPSCAVPLAALIKNKDKFKGQKVAIIITGGNLDFANVPFLMK